MEDSFRLMETVVRYIYAVIFLSGGLMIFSSLVSGWKGKGRIAAGDHKIRITGDHKISLGKILKNISIGDDLSEEKEREKDKEFMQFEIAAVKVRRKIVGEEEEENGGGRGSPVDSAKVKLEMNLSSDKLVLENSEDSFLEEEEEGEVVVVVGKTEEK